MTSDLSLFAARLRDDIAICAQEPARAPACEPALPARHDAEFDGLARALFALQFNHNPAYRTLCEAKKISPNSVTHWTQIPAVPASAFKESDFTCLPAEARPRVFHSSGTTEQRPSRHFHNAESLAVYEASLWPWFAAHVLSDLKFEISNFRLSILTPPPDQAPHSSLVHMFETVRRRSGAPASVFAGTTARDRAWTLNFDAALAALRQAAAEQQSMVLLGTAFSFVHLLEDLAEHNLRFALPPGSRVMETGGYKGRARALSKTDLHSFVTQQLGIPPAHIVGEYGMSELSSQAYDLRLSASRITDHSLRSTLHAPRIFRFPPWARAQIISPETNRPVAEGETGLLRIFDLANVFSVMAIQTEDLAIRRGDGFELIGRAERAEPRGCSLMANDS